MYLLFAHYFKIICIASLNKLSNSTVFIMSPNLYYLKIINSNNNLRNLLVKNNFILKNENLFFVHISFQLNIKIDFFIYLTFG